MLLDFTFISRKPLEYDELLTWHLSRADWRTLWICDVEPPGFYLWAKPIRFLSDSPLSLRVFEALAAGLWVVPVWATADALGGRQLATLATLTLTFHPLRLRCGQYGRADAVSVLFDLLSLWVLVALLRRRGAPPGLALLLFLLSTLAWFTYLPFVTSLLSRVAVLVVLVALGRAPWGALWAVLGSVGLFVGWSMVHVVPHAPGLERSFLGGLLLGVLEPPIGHMTAFFGTGLENFSAAVAIPLNLVAFLGAVSMLGRPIGAIVVGSWAGPVALLGLMCGLGIMPPQQGYLSAVLGPFAICLGAGLLRLGRPIRSLVGVLLLLLLAGCGVLLRRPVGTVDFLSPARFILSNYRPGDIVFCQPPGADIAMRYYLGGNLRVEPLETTFCTRAGNFAGLPARPLTKVEWEAIKERSSKASRLWLVEWHYSPSVPLRWPRWPEERGYKAILRRGFLGQTQAVVVTLYMKGVQNVKGGGESVKKAEGGT